MTEPPCARCGQAMTVRDEPDEYECKPCKFALAPLSEMCKEDGLMLLYSIIGADYSIHDLPHKGELEKWLVAQWKGTP